MAGPFLDLLVPNPDIIEDAHKRMPERVYICVAYTKPRKQFFKITMRALVLDIREPSRARGFEPHPLRQFAPVSIENGACPLFFGYAFFGEIGHNSFKFFRLFFGVIGGHM
jgi:hypothetical protein